MFYYHHRKPLLRQTQRQRAADHSPADNGNFRWLICHGHSSCYVLDKFTGFFTH
ncbi:Uncharacterised protein [Salmonella enterica subsp. enterica serovar Bovismorbificans]|uniref:Uncharacterized protein n=1 Tax=Salmonella enterica subsp. enterica serovar Bovismorbificans TaxID=58097 RepID=A0A655BST3_SALET|nr:Uncharacterised protein [Salmonella enterica subsp. enterica serovar Bovismorbificans]